MNARKQIDADLLSLPEQLDLADAVFYESSGASGDRTLYVEGDGAAYLKIAPAGSLERAARMQAYFHQKGLSSEVLAYFSLDRDYLLTAAIDGEDGTTNRYLAQPERLSRVFGEALRALHETKASDCPAKKRMEAYLADAGKARFDQNHLDRVRDFIGAADADKAGEEIVKKRDLLANDTLIHGDYCLPNIMIRRWKFTGFIDVADGGLGDAHYDLAWGLWTLAYNLKTPDYGKTFLKAYGEEKIDMPRLRICGLLAAME